MIENLFPGVMAVKGLGEFIGEKSDDIVNRRGFLEAIATENRFTKKKNLTSNPTTEKEGQKYIDDMLFETYRELDLEIPIEMIKCKYNGNTSKPPKDLFKKPLSSQVKNPYGHMIPSFFQHNIQRGFSYSNKDNNNDGRNIQIDFFPLFFKLDKQSQKDELILNLIRSNEYFNGIKIPGKNGSKKLLPRAQYVDVYADLVEFKSYDLFFTQFSRNTDKKFDKNYYNYSVLHKSLFELIINFKIPYDVRRIIDNYLMNYQSHIPDQEKYTTQHQKRIFMIGPRIKL